MIEMFKKILCPIELSDDCQPLVDLAAALAVEHSAELVLLHVAIPPLAQESMYAGEDVESVIVADQMRFEKIRPSSEIKTQHVFLRGNPGPETIKFAESIGCDLIVLGTHGRSGVFRVLMGSVAEYISRHAHCPVLTLRNPGKRVDTKQETTNPVPRKSPAPVSATSFVTKFMKHAPAIHAHDEMPDVIGEFSRHQVSAAPVVAGNGECIGILTTTDVDRYRDIKRRYDEKDPTVISEMFEVDEFGQLRTNNSTFEQVMRHMTSPVVTISNSESVQDALDKFENNPDIHHLIVVDEKNRPQGFVEPQFFSSTTDTREQHA